MQSGRLAAIVGLFVYHFLLFIDNGFWPFLLLSMLVSEKRMHSLTNNSKMNKIIRFGEKVDGYEIPVLNEREIRASAGILFLGTFISLMNIIYKGNFLMIKYVITLFLTDFLILCWRKTKEICVDHWCGAVGHHVCSHGARQLV
jgi:hypothetical protein